ncbi:putative baseplate assembly protein (plasmid) [Kovacikia minuta CCNUW1]|uniref:putative baseplate assembly protein n=1 Tax=Kovacikia minuta TaxID=2931930 RepID=UPI001CC8FD3A|nr:putative baseplate assembly protein [Kovacikia minuta]UBF30459.1 putative baseplate assembly protein [Kovacikia minuta CCNUW1]
MEFDFLPKLPKSNLDDRTFKDLVDECILRIPRYCPEWTNYNPGDPGITLVELFAWLTDQMLMRFNQVPRRNYVVFLEMLGVRLQAATPAQTELTFYLSAALPQTYQIPSGTEVATVRTETEEAIVFSTDQPLTIGKPRITQFLTAETAEPAPQFLRDRLTNLWTQQADGSWAGREQQIFEERPQPGNCFYLVLDPDSPIEGNVLALKLRGEAATSTGINPDHPPRRWEAWNGERWQPVLLQELDDSTRGFSFKDIGEPALNPVQEADVVLHLPLQFPASYFASYQGRWLRCVYTPPEGMQSGYNRSPQLVGFSIRAIGGTVIASQCTLIQDELLGQSEGTPGQTFQLQSQSILPRREGEHLLVIPPNGLPEVWQEVNDFADSGPQDHHYTLDSLTGELQFGPLIREPAQLREQVQFRARTQINGESALQVGNQAITVQLMERQYGAIPPRGAQLRMVAYRTGGGRKGNVQRGTLQIPKTAVPYVAHVTNHVPAHNGADAESLEDAVIRVPRLLRTRDRAVTPEDFETLALQAGAGAVARTCCPPRTEDMTPGAVDLLLVPQTNVEGIQRAEGIHPDRLTLTQPLKEQVLTYLDDRRLLGTQVRLKEPNYVGVAVQAEVGLDPEYNHPQAQQVILRSLQVALYRFLNPLTGGADRNGWNFGCPVYPSDIVNLFQQTVGVRFLGAILLFELHRQGDTWTRSLSSTGIVDPGPLGLICSWADNRLRSSHAISLIG